MTSPTSETARKAARTTESDASADRRWRAGPVQSGAWRTVAATALLATVTIGWTAYPLDTGRAGTRITLVVAIAAGILTITQTALVTVARVQAPDYAPFYLRSADWLLGFIRGTGWPEILVVALLVLEALHRAWPLHVGVLGVALLGLLFAVHLAETGAGPSVLRAQVPVIAAGIGLLALAVGVASVHEATSGPAYTAIRILAIVAAVVAAALAVPAGGRRRL
jgi:hypothetical protein